jgi:hypothetical protein
MTCIDFFLLSMFFQQSAYHIGFKPLVKSVSNIVTNATKFEKKNIFQVALSIASKQSLDFFQNFSPSQNIQTLPFRFQKRDFLGY